MPDVTEAEMEILHDEEQRHIRVAVPQQQVQVRTTLCAAWPDGQTLVVARHFIHEDGRLELAETYRKPTADEAREVQKRMKTSGVRFVMGGPSEEGEGEKRNIVPYVLGAVGIASGLAGLVWALWPSDGAEVEDEEEDDGPDEDDE